MNILLARIVDKIIDATSKDALTSNEISVYIRLAMLQEKSSNYVQGIYWKEIADYLQISKSGYYFVLQELERKGYIERVKVNRMDTDIIMKDHELSNIVRNIENGTNSEKYIKLNTNVFNDKKFYDLKANEKRLVLIYVKRYMPDSNGNKFFFEPGNEFADYKKILGVDVSAIKKYYKNIKQWVSVSGDVIINNRVKHIVTLLKGAVETPTRTMTQSGEKRSVKKYAEFDSHEHIIRTYCRREKVVFDLQNLSDTASLINQYKKKFRNASEDIITYVKSAIMTSMEETIELSSKVVNKILSNISKKYETENQDDKAPEGTYNDDRNKESGRKNRYSNLDQRKYNYESLEKELLGINPDVDNLITEF